MQTCQVIAAYGETFEYKHAYSGNVHYEDGTSVHVTIEEFIDGECVKFINNTCSLCPRVREDFKEKLLKAECLAHYSYHYSKNRLLLTDIQGVGYTLIDPEIATHNEDALKEDERMVYREKHDW